VSSGLLQWNNVFGLRLEIKRPGTSAPELPEASWLGNNFYYNAKDFFYLNRTELPLLRADCLLPFPDRPLEARFDCLGTGVDCVNCVKPSLDML
jgi:hypothetical protein